MSARRTVRSLTALAVVLGGALSGCTDTAAEPRPLPSVTSSPTPSKSASPTPPALPAEARGTSAASAKAFVRHWIAALNFSGVAEDSRTLRSLSTDSCVSCVGIENFIDDVRTKRGSIRGDGWIVKSLRLIDKGGGDNAVVVDALVQVTPQTVIRKKGGSVQNFKGGKRLKTFWLKSASGEWRVVRLDQPE